MNEKDHMSLVQIHVTTSDGALMTQAIVSKKNDYLLLPLILMRATAKKTKFQQAPNKSQNLTDGMIFLEQTI